MHTHIRMHTNMSPYAHAYTYTHISIHIQVGWDCMVMEDEIVFFEGNFTGARTPRRIFLSSTHFWNFMTKYFWPFGRNAVTPGFQGFC